MVRTSWTRDIGWLWPGIWSHIAENVLSSSGVAPTFYMHRRYGGRSLVLRLRKKEGIVHISCWRSYFARPSAKLRGHLGSFSPGISPPKQNIFFLMWIWGPSRKSGPNQMSFQFLTGGRLTKVDIAPPPLNLKTLATPLLSSVRDNIHAD